MNRHSVYGVIEGNILQDDPLASLHLATVINGPANGWLNRIRTSTNIKAACQARDDATAYVASLEQRREVSTAQADQLFEIVDGQWRECMAVLEGQITLEGDQS
ncbi:hypothetical protein [Pseudomonas zeae]|uniref:hypothetical protein n=1 Tax=Pseudomonas zeae TaxID=2745510 RepID=UPI0039E011FB